MFVGIVGPTCSGKHETMNILASICQFTCLYLRPTSPGFSSNGNITDISNGNANSSKLEFDTIEAMMGHVTLNWMEHFVTCDVQTIRGISILRKRPFFLLLSVECSTMVRYRRCVSRCKGQGLASPTLEEFVEMTDASLYTMPSISSAVVTPVMSQSTFPAPSNGFEQSQDQYGSTASEAPLSPPDQDLSPSPSSSGILHFNYAPYKLLSMSDLSILNNHPTRDYLQRDIEALDITNPDLLRPSWDSYFMYLANLAARRSNCMKRRVGCVLVREKRVIATGYNGTPKNLTNCNDGCAIKIVQVGVSQVVYSESYGMDDLTAEVFRKAGVELRQHATPSIKLDQSNP
ncbi:Deoxycytidine monophosphate (dCMP) deaminase [Dissophora ornata]|nr:Deoxycytidine monophosphate (dCMP) deaminase [Dissophora ornata]